MNAGRLLIAIFLFCVAVWCFYHGYTLERDGVMADTAYRSPLAFFIYGATMLFAAFMFWVRGKSDE